MKWLKDRLFSLRLKSNLSSRHPKKEVVNQNKVRSIGLLFNESQISNQRELQAYIDKWTKNGKAVETFSFVDIKEFEETTDDAGKFCRKDVNWFQVPQGDKIDAFVNKPYDILITINPAKKRYLHFLNAVSSAKFKIGLLPDVVEFYDLLIDLDENATVKKIFSDIQETLDKLSI